MNDEQHEQEIQDHEIQDHEIQEQESRELDRHDASLGRLEIAPGELIPGLWGERREFAVRLPHRTDSIRLHPHPIQPSTQVHINGTAVGGESGSSCPLEVGRNLFNIVVTAPDGRTTRAYTLKVQRGAATPSWKQVRDTSPWPPRDSAGELVFKDRMWLLGGYVPELISDVWSSADGDEWQKTGEIPTTAGINIPVNFVHDDKMWVSSNDGCLYASADGAQWTLVSDNIPCLPRYGAGGVVFNGRMWILGGAGNGTVYNDVWSSSDGVRWMQETDAAPWSRRQLFGNVVVHDGKMWVVGGGLTNYQPFKAYRDVWCSSDGRNWTQVADEAPWPARIWSCCAVYRNRIWLLGGFRAQPSWNNFNDVWYSSDGANWQLLEIEDIKSDNVENENMWSPRHELSAYVHHERLWVVGGNAWPLLNDVWQLHLPGLAFTSQPVLEEIVHCRYTYHARADFHAGAGVLRYALTESPDWLSIDASSGTITGTPPETGDFVITVEARDEHGEDEHGETAQQSYVLSVITPP